MQLAMYISNILIACIPLEYEGLLSCSDKQELQEKIAAELTVKHNGKISLVDERPQFFVEGVESKMNRVRNERAFNRLQ